MTTEKRSDDIQRSPPESRPSQPAHWLRSQSGQVRRLTRRVLAHTLNVWINHPFNIERARQGSWKHKSGALPGRWPE
jgi:hypothetical protein